MTNLERTQTTASSSQLISRKSRQTTCIFILAMTLASFLFQSCSSKAPRASTILHRSSMAMLDVMTARFSVRVHGELSGPRFVSAEGVATSDGQATTTLIFPGQTLPLQFNWVGGKGYLKDPTTGRWIPQQANEEYNASILLDRNSGLPSILDAAIAENGSIVQSVNGTTCFRVVARVEPSAVRPLTELAPGQPTLQARFWIARAGSRLIKAQVTFRSRGSQTLTNVTLTLSRFNDPNNRIDPITTDEG